MPTNPNQDDYELGAMGWGSNVAGGAASGAVAGSSLGPIGAGVGGLIGGGLGVVQSLQQQKLLDAESARQAELDAELAKAAADYDLFRMGANLGASQRGDASQIAAQQAAARGNLTAGSSAGLQQQAAHDSASEAMQMQAGMGMAAQQAKLMQQQQVLDEYRVAQELANGTQVNTDLVGSIGAIGGNLAELAGKAKAGWGQDAKAPAADPTTTARSVPTADSEMARTLGKTNSVPDGVGLDFQSEVPFKMNESALSPGALLPGALGAPGAAAAFAPAALPPKVPEAALAPPSAPINPAGWVPGAGVEGTGERGGAAGMAARAQGSATQAPDPTTVAAGPDFTDVETFKAAFAGMADEATLTKMYQSPDFDQKTAGTVYRSSQYVQKMLRYVPQTPEGAAQAMADPTFLMALQNIDPTIKTANVVVGPGGNLIIARPE